MITDDGMVLENTQVYASNQVDAAFDRMARLDVVMELIHRRSRRRRIYSLTTVLMTLVLLEGCTRLF